MKTKEETIDAMKALGPFIGPIQKQILGSNAARGEEREWFRDILCTMAAKVEAMPKTYEQDGLGENAVAHLHYFTGGFDWYITEKDAGSPDDEPGQAQSQAFGLADLYHDGGELGYISLPEILSCGAELDLHFEPKTLAAIRAKRYPQPEVSTEEAAAIAEFEGAPSGGPEGRQFLLL